MVGSKGAEMRVCRLRVLGSRRGGLHVRLWGLVTEGG